MGSVKGLAERVGGRGVTANGEEIVRGVKKKKKKKMSSLRMEKGCCPNRQVTEAGSTEKTFQSFRENKESVIAYRKHNWQILVKHAACLHMPNRSNLAAQSGTRHGAAGSLLFTCSAKSFANAFRIDCLVISASPLFLLPLVHILLPCILSEPQLFLSIPHVHAQTLELLRPRAAYCTMHLIRLCESVMAEY